MGAEPDIIVRYVKVVPRHIVLLKSLLEGYEGLVVVRTQDPREGIVQLLISPDFGEDMEEILRDLSRHMRIQPIPAPETSTGDRSPW
ncbi:MAG: DUF4911 domain-containing protein [bacterium]